MQLYREGYSVGEIALELQVNKTQVQPVVVELKRVEKNATIERIYQLQLEVVALLRSLSGLSKSQLAKRMADLENELLAKEIGEQAGH